MAKAFHEKHYFYLRSFRYTARVTQSYVNSLLGDVVLDTFNKVYKNEDSNLGQTYKKANMFGFLL